MINHWMERGTRAANKSLIRRGDEFSSNWWHFGIEMVAFYRQGWDLLHMYTIIRWVCSKMEDTPVYDTGLQMMVNQKMEWGSKIRVVGAGILARAQMANFFSWPWKCDPPDTHDLVREQRGGHGQDCSSGRSGGGGWKMSSFSFQTGSGYTI
jgi:hypothetical protein